MTKTRELNDLHSAYVQASAAEIMRARCLAIAHEEAQAVDGGELYIAAKIRDRIAALAPPAPAKRVDDGEEKR
jgi:hypothetical protein